MSPNRILLIDDQQDEAIANLFSIQDELKPVHPNDLEDKHLQNITLVLVDHQLEKKYWEQRDAMPFVGRPMDGLAVASIIRAHLRSNLFEQHPPVGIALYSAKLSKVTPGFDNPPEHIAARTADLEWAFNKRDLSTLPPQAKRIKELADAIARLGELWQSRLIQDNEEAWSDMEKLLHLSPEVNWSPLARLQIERCHPPMHEMAEWSDGLAVIRWLSQRILPYPTFLLDYRHLALRLGVSPKTFRLALANNSALFKALEPAKYTGILSTFLGDRWWSKGIDTLIWEATQGQSMAMDQVRAWLQGHTEIKLEAVSDEHTLVLGPDAEHTEELSTFDQCVQIQPDDWPPYAKSVWTTIEKAKQHERLRTWITASDVEKLNQ